MQDTFFAYIDSNRNRFSEWAIGFRYGNFFILRVVKNLKLALGKEKAYLPRAFVPWEGKLFFPWANLMVFYNPWDEETSIP